MEAEMDVDAYASLSTHLAKSDTPLSHNPSNQRANCHNNNILTQVLRHHSNGIYPVEQMVGGDASGLNLSADTTGKF